MQKKAERLEALRKPPPTQEERLREAAIVEKRNSKSLNRWEEAEKQREEALSSRTLKGPVITFWSGIADFGGGEMKHVGRHIVIEEQPKKKKREKVDKDKDKEKEKDKDKAKEEVKGQAKDGQTTGKTTNAAVLETTNDPSKANADVKPEPDGQPTATAPPEKSPSEVPPTATTSVTAKNEAIPTPTPSSTEAPTSTSTIQAPPPALKQEETPASLAMPPPPPSSGLAAPAPPPEASTPSVGSLMAPPAMARPPELNNSKPPSSVLAPPVLAPPPGISINGSPVPGFSPKSNVLAPPDTSQQHVGPPPMQQGIAATRPPSNPAPAPATATADPAPDKPVPTPLQPIQNPAVLNKAASVTPSETPVDSPAAEKPAAETACNAIIYQHFDENAIRDKNVQTQILFGRKMTKLASKSTHEPPPSHSRPPTCHVEHLS
jgi:vacuolar protein sorting-associated protein 72